MNHTTQIYASSVVKNIFSFDDFVRLMKLLKKRAEINLFVKLFAITFTDSCVFHRRSNVNYLSFHYLLIVSKDFNIA